MVKSIEKESKVKILKKKPSIKLKLAKCFRNTTGDTTNSSTEEVSIEKKSDKDDEEKIIDNIYLQK